MTANILICEFNPLHKGHGFVLSRAKQAYPESTLVAVMSGNIVQRGTAPVYDKFTRAEAAVRCGADLVLELPYPYSTESAEFFARGGIDVALGIGADSLTFGSESGDLEKIERIAEIKSSPDHALCIAELDRAERDLGTARVYEKLLSEHGVTDVGANDKLASEYVRYGRLGGIEQYTVVPRLTELSSATEIRRIMEQGGITAAREHIPEEAYRIFEQATAVPEARFNEVIFTYARLSELDSTDILRYIKKVADSSENAAEYIENLPTKKYTLARLRRELLRDIIKPHTDEKCRVTQLLAANSRGCEYLGAIRKSAGIKIITKPADASDLDEAERAQYDTICRADRFYALLRGERAGYYLTKTPKIL